MNSPMAEQVGTGRRIDPAVPGPASTAECFLRLLRSRGIENFFINAGTDFAPIVEGYARFAGAAETAFPRPVIAAHENVVMGMAHGAYLMTGNPQAVMFHVNVGTANAVCGAMNAARENVPLMICAGRSPIYEGGMLGARNTRVAWGQEMFDQAAIVRESVKWEYELRGSLHVQDVVDRALTIAMTEPRGPVYLTLPREVIAQQSAVEISPSARVSVPTASYPDPEAVGRLADAMIDAEMPVISAMASGADRRTVALLAEICDRFGIGYAEEQARYLNLPSDHPHHLGFRLPPIMPEVDAWLFLESDVPWVEEWGSPREDAFVAHAGADAAFSAYPMRTHRCDLAITAGAYPLLLQLTAALTTRASRLDPDRRDRIATRAAKVRKAVELDRSAALKEAPRITTDMLSAALGEMLPADAVLFNEYWAVPQLIPRTEAGSYFYLPATGGLGWALPAALGAKLANPAATVVAAVGDGTYMFSNPVACHHASQKHDLPVLTVIANNARWGAVDSTAKLVYPNGYMSHVEWIAISDLRPSPDYAGIVAASGGVGIDVERPDDLREALADGLRIVREEGRQVVVNVSCV